MGLTSFRAILEVGFNQLIMMKFPLLAIILLFFQTTLSQDLPYELLNPEVVSVNRMPMRASAYAFETRTLAEKGAKEESRFFLSLNGHWKYNWVKDPAQRPGDFFSQTFDDGDWKEFPVPANWELNGYGLPIYVNQPYEFTGHAKRYGQLNPPYDIPVDNNPVGSYRKKFVLPEDWDVRQVFIHLGAVKSAFFIWVNGEKAGYSEDSKLAAEFDITPYIKKGENLIALQVYRWSDASYLECQDMWRISGIERDVYIYSTPKLDLRDFKIISTLDNEYKDGVLKINADVFNYRIDHGTLHSRPDTFSIDVELKDAGGLTVYTNSSSTNVLGNYKTTVAFETSIPLVKQWSAEIPNLYSLFLTLKNKNGKVLQVIARKVGFRSVELKNRNLLVNGKRIFLKGVNRHEHHPTKGHVLSRQDMIKDMEMMKKLNINAVRHSHYPPDPFWLELCDEYGLYVVDEANIESHGLGYDLSVSLGNNKQWRNAHLERIQRMYERDKNFTSIVTWSLGNEAGNGVNFYEAYEWLKKSDIRPVQYERAESDYNTDMLVPQYPDPISLERFSKTNPSRPMIMSEYAHIMGNSLGNFKDYWDVIENNPYLQGGFIWEWIDQSIDTIKNGKRIKAYGGDFPLEGPVDENISDNNFCVKGVVTAHRELTPMAIEIKKVHQSIKSRLTGKNQLEIINGYFFRNTGNIQMNWELLEDGKIIEKGTVGKTDLEPGEKKTIGLPYRSKQQNGKEYFLNVHYTLIHSEPFLEAGHEIAYDQFKLNELPIRSKPGTVKGSINISNTDGQLLIKGKVFSIGFDLVKGMMSSYVLNGKELLQQGPVPSFWRAPTDNDIGAGFNRTLREWRDAYPKGKLVETTNRQVNNNVHEVVFKKDLLNGNAFIEQSFTIYPDGSVKVDNQFRAVKGNYRLLLRVGNDLVMNKEFDRITFYGLGPWENYQDRYAASMVGIFRQTLDEQYFPYARPQESGNKTGVRWVNFTNNNGRGLRFEMVDTLLSFSALPYSLDDLDPEIDKKQYHSGELVKRNEIYLHMDQQQTGMQGIDSWGAWPMEKYRVPFNDHQYSYWIRPIN